MAWAAAGAGEARGGVSLREAPRSYLCDHVRHPGHPGVYIYFGLLWHTGLVLFRSRVDRFVTRTQHVILRMVDQVQRISEKPCMRSRLDM